MVEDGAQPALPEDYFHTPSPARMWNYLQGGKDHYQIDRDAGDAMASADPDIRYLARQSRLFMNRAAHWVAAEGGVRQFLDIGCGLPVQQSMLNTHEVAQDVDPLARVVYIDNDKVVLAHARALLTSRLPGAGAIDYIESDARDIERIVTEAERTLDFTRPIAVIMIGVLGAVEFTEATAIVDAVMAAVPSGSYLIVSDGLDVEVRRESVRRRNATGNPRPLPAAHP
jgi:S-adenosyl methyltransferase